MENQGPLQTSNNLNLTTQTLYPLTNAPNLSFAQSVVQDAANISVIKEMEEEIMLWVCRIIAYFVVTVLFYVNLEYHIPLELLFLLPVLLDILLCFYYFKKSKHTTYFCGLTHRLDEHEKYYCVLEAVQCIMSFLFKVTLCSTKHSYQFISGYPSALGTTVGHALFF